MTLEQEGRASLQKSFMSNQDMWTSLEKPHFQRVSFFLIQGITQGKIRFIGKERSTELSFCLSLVLFCFEFFWSCLQHAWPKNPWAGDQTRTPTATQAAAVGFLTYCATVRTLGPFFGGVRNRIYFANCGWLFFGFIFLKKRGTL